MKNSDLTFLILPVWKPFLHLIFQIILLKVQIITDYKPHKHTVQSERDTTAILPMCYTGIMLSDNMLNLMALRYAASSGHMTLESFISLILRLECMHSKWSRAGRVMLTVTKGERVCAQDLPIQNCGALTFCVAQQTSSSGCRMEIAWVSLSLR